MHFILGTPRQRRLHLVHRPILDHDVTARRGQGKLSRDLESGTLHQEVVPEHVLLEEIEQPCFLHPKVIKVVL